jgi:hypothetical protein
MLFGAMHMHPSALPSRLQRVWLSRYRRWAFLHVSLAALGWNRIFANVGLRCRLNRSTEHRTGIWRTGRPLHEEATVGSGAMASRRARPHDAGPGRVRPRSASCDRPHRVVTFGVTWDFATWGKYPHSATISLGRYNKIGWRLAKEKGRSEKNSTFGRATRFRASHLQ